MMMRRIACIHKKCRSSHKKAAGNESTPVDISVGINIDIKHGEWYIWGGCKEVQPSS